MAPRYRLKHANFVAKSVPLSCSHGLDPIRTRDRDIEANTLASAQARPLVLKAVAEELLEAEEPASRHQCGDGGVRVRSLLLCRN